MPDTTKPTPWVSFMDDATWTSVANLQCSATFLESFVTRQAQSRDQPFFELDTTTGQFGIRNQRLISSHGQETYQGVPELQSGLFLNQCSIYRGREASAARDSRRDIVQRNKRIPAYDLHTHRHLRVRQLDAAEGVAAFEGILPKPRNPS
jgi:hypothetical protein